MLSRAVHKLAAAALSPAGSSLGGGRALYGAGSCKMQGFGTQGFFTASPAAATPQAEASPKVPEHPSERELAVHMLDVEMDMDEGPEMAVVEGLPNPAERMDPLGRPVDLETEFDRDDTECLTQEEIEALQSPQVRAAVMEALGRPVDIETELDRDDVECMSREDIEELHNPKVRAAVKEAIEQKRAEEEGPKFGDTA